jgi:hypothetical protein
MCSVSRSKALSQTVKKEIMSPLPWIGMHRILVQRLRK